MAPQERFDPRVHSSVLLNFNEKLPGKSLLIKSAELPVKTFVVGPHVSAKRSSSTPRPSSAPASKTAHPDPIAPKFLDKSGYWVASALPEQPRATQAQPLASSLTATALVVNSLMPKQRGAVRPVSAVHSYNDISPIISGEHMREAGGFATMSYTLGNSKLGGFTGAVTSPGAAAPAATTPRSILEHHAALSSPGGAPAIVGSPASSPRAAVAPSTPKQRASSARPYSSNSAGVTQQQQQRATTAAAFRAQAGTSALQLGVPAEGAPTHEEMYYYRDPAARAGVPTKTTKAGLYHTVVDRAHQGTHHTRPLSAGPEAYSADRTRRGAAQTGWEHTQHGGQDYMVNMLVTGENKVKVGSLYRTARHGSVPRNTGEWTSLEPQADTVLKPGHLGVPLEHPFSEGHTYNPAPYYGGQYTIKGQRPGKSKPGASGKGSGSGATVEQQAFFTHASSSGVPEPPYASAAGNPFWKTESNVLGPEDLMRAEELSRGVLGGTANAKLVGGKWKLIPRPTEGDVVYTDFYGRYGKDMSNYYGRSYTNDAKEFAKNRLVNDSAYQKVRASMMGIQALRDRPGLSMDATLVHGTPEQLAKVGSGTQAHKTLHHIEQYDNLRPTDKPVFVVA